MAAGLVARVIIDIDVAHLDRPFDYAIPARFRDRVRLGSVVRVKWGGVRRTGWVVGVSSSSDHVGKLEPILLVLGDEPQFSAEMLRTYEYIALRNGANLSQVLSIAIPPRRAKVEGGKEPVTSALNFEYQGNENLNVAYPGQNLELIGRGVVTAVPHMVRGHLAQLITSFTHKGVPLIIVVPTTVLAEELYRWISKSTRSQSTYLLTSNQSPVERYRAHLAGMHGHADIIVGTRMAAWAATGKPAMMIVWDEASEHSRERRAPQVDALDIGVARAHLEGHGLLIAGFSRSIKAQALVHSGWARDVSPAESVLRAQIPKIRVTGPENIEREGSTTHSLLPDSAFRLIRRGLEEGPVLVQVPKSTQTVAQTDLDGVKVGEFEVGVGRVSRDLGRAFVQTRIIISSADEGIRRDPVEDRAIVVATPGAAPPALLGYAGVVCLNADLLIYSDRLSALEQAGARWFSSFSLAKPGRPVLLCGDIPEQVKRWLILWRPEELAKHLLNERIELGFFPAKWIVAVEGYASDVAMVVEAIEKKQIESVTVSGSVVVKEDHETLFASTDFGNETIRTFIACDTNYAMDLMEEIRAIRISRSIARQAPVNIGVNPPEMF